MIDSSPANPREVIPVIRARVLLADDHLSLLERVGQLLEREFDVVGKVRDGQALLVAADRLKPDLFILDLSMPVMSGLDAARQLMVADSEAKIVILTVHEDPDLIREAFAAGALGYVIKSRMASDLVAAAKEVLAGRSFISLPLDPVKG